MYLVFDLETQTHKLHKRKGSPWHPDNYIVQRGWKYRGRKVREEYFNNRGESRKGFLRIKPGTKLLVGFNIKYDLLWELENGNEDLIRFFKEGGQIWDGQLAEYFLMAQHPKWQMCSLNDTAPKYGGTVKIDVIKEMWEAGIQTSEIPRDLLTEYLIGNDEYDGDIGNTEKVFLGQVAKAKKLGMLKMIRTRMDSLICSTFMEFYGLHIDMEVARKDQKELEDKIAELDKTLVKSLPKDLPPELEFNWSSNYHMSYLLFGGCAKYQKRLPYKNDEGEWVCHNIKSKFPIFKIKGKNKEVDPRKLGWVYEANDSGP